VQGQYVAGRRFAMRVVLAFGALAIILTGIGLFSVIAYLVQLRTREIGIRMAVGATQARIGGSVLLNGLAHAAAGVAAGLGGFAIAARIVAAKVPNFWTIDAAGCAFAVVFVTIVAMAAAWVPARRAARVDPLVALRAE
jgi:ABC-type antimicrobial peptide transport system permease subunit